MCYLIVLIPDLCRLSYFELIGNKSWARIWCQWNAFGPRWLRLLYVLGCGSVFVDLLFIVAPIVCGGSVFGPCFVIQYFVSVRFCGHLDGEERAGCFALTVYLVSCGGQCSVALSQGPWVCVPCVNVIFPDHTHLLFW